ncbi:MAG: alpha/beta hydrolase [Xanthomonadales bacterium]|jgi:pimeloyl-ACP methyl ester carboxylesterase|nr:alpha/beta hydrolase [Xanthomonadales bacterium]MDH3940903.1 alpha/beta hydrolase [Xanthomonadales bacterium]MDH4002212.1 alpha/beta hydrolase [Xanthomonadales bacterium]
MQLEINGHEVYVATGNKKPDPDKDTVLFIHGTGQDHTIWVLPTRYFARHDRNVLAVDLPGHGRSGGQPLQSIEAMADWAVQVLDASGLSRASVVGHSLGSLIAIATAARHPDRVRAIALVGVTVPMPVSEFLLEQARHGKHEAIEMLNYWGYSKSAQLGGNATPGNWMLGGGMRLMERAGPGVIYTDLNACNEYIEGLEHAADIACPALLILGERDMLTPVRSAMKVVSALPNAEQVILKGSGHALLAEKPDPVLDQLIRVV